MLSDDANGDDGGEANCDDDVELLMMIGMTSLRMTTTPTKAMTTVVDSDCDDYFDSDESDGGDDNGYCEDYYDYGY